MTKILARFLHTTSKLFAAKPGVVARVPRARPGTGPVDKRHEMMKIILFETKQKEITDISDADAERHEAIEAAFNIYKQESTGKRKAELEAKFRAMEAAYKELENTDLHLLNDACRKYNRPLFPLQLRAPTDTPPKVVWNHNSIFKKQ